MRKRRSPQENAFAEVDYHLGTAWGILEKLHFPEPNPELEEVIQAAQKAIGDAVAICCPFWGKPKAPRKPHPKDT